MGGCCSSESERDRFFDAIDKLDAATVKAMLNDGFYINTLSRDNLTGLIHLCTRDGDGNNGPQLAALANLLLAHPKIDKDRAVGGRSALLRALEHVANDELIDALFDAGVSTEGAAHTAAIFGKPAVVRRLLQQKQQMAGVGGGAEPHGDAAGVNDVDLVLNGWTILLAAVENSQFEVAQLLLEEFHADTEIPTPDGETALVLACQNGDARMVELLLNHGADRTKKSQTGKTCVVMFDLGTSGAGQHKQLMERLAGEAN